MNNVNRINSGQVDSSNKNFWIFFTVLVLLTVYMIFSYQPLNKLYFGDDSIFHFKRFSVLMEALKTNSFPIYIDNDGPAGFGYATRWFYPDLLLIPFAYIANVTGLIFGFKFMLFTFTILCGLFSYKLIYRVFENQYTASIGSIVYTFALYRLYDVYSRSALGETMSITFLPIVFLGLYEVINGNYKKWYILTIGYALLIFSHLLSSVLTFFFVIAFILIYYKKFIETPKRILYLIIAGLVTLPMIAYLVLPLLEQIASQQFFYQTPSVSDHAHVHKITISHLMKSFYHGFVPSTEGWTMVSLGLIITLLACLRIFVRSPKNKLLRLADIGTIIAIVCIILTCKIAPWGRFPLEYLSFIQFPWRMFEFATFFLSISGAYYLTLVAQKINKKMLLAVIVIVLNIISLTINGYSYRNSPVYITEQKPTIENHFNYGHLEYVPRKFRSFPGISYPNTEYIYARSGIIKSEEGTSSISNFKRENGIISLDINTNDPDVIELPTFYYRGYSATFNGQNTEIHQSKEGLIEIPVNQSGQIQVAFTGTFIQKYSIYITLISTLLLIIYIFRSRRSKC